MQRILSIELNTEYFFVRVFGYGFSIDYKKERNKLFSERCGFRRCFYIGFVKFELLKRHAEC